MSEQKIYNLSSGEKAVRVASFYEILKGKSATVLELAARTGLTREQVQANVKSLLQKGMLVVGDNEDIVGSHGLSLVPTEHRLNINGQKLFAWCAIDAIGIPAALGLDAQIYSRCFLCHDPVEITMLQGEISSSNHEDIRVWVVDIDIGRSIVGCS